MLLRLLTLMPHQPGTITLAVTLIGSLAGLSLWIAGARLSQYVLTLLAVGLGTWIGMKLPLWCNWQVDEMGPAVGGAVILGVSGFAMHRLWVGISLGAVLTAWSALALWATLGSHWRCPAYEVSQTLPAYFEIVWKSLPSALSQYLGLAAMGSMIVGVASAFIWPRITIVLMWSAAGVSMLTAAAASVAARFDSAILPKIPRQTSAQLIVLGALVAIGAFFQWRSMFVPQTAVDPVDSPEPEEKKSPRKRQPAD